MISIVSAHCYIRLYSWGVGLRFLYIYVVYKLHNPKLDHKANALCKHDNIYDKTRLYTFVFEYFGVYFMYGNDALDACSIYTLFFSYLFFNMAPMSVVMPCCWGMFSSAPLLLLPLRSLLRTLYIQLSRSSTRLSQCQGLFKICMLFYQDITQDTTFYILMSIY